MKLKTLIILSMLLILLGCIANKADIDCHINDPHLSKDVKTICLINKAMYQSIEGHVSDALNSCNEIKNLQKISYKLNINNNKTPKKLNNYMKAINTVSVLKSTGYNRCIKMVALFAEDENICNKINPKRGNLGLILNFVSNAPSQLFGLSTDKEECIEDVEMKIAREQSTKDLINTFISLYSYKINNNPNPNPNPSTNNSTP